MELFELPGADYDDAITAGNEAIMTDLSATSVLAMRQAVKNIFYTTVNSSAYKSYEIGSIPVWMQTMYIIDLFLLAALIICEVVLLRSEKKKRMPS